MKTLHSKTLSSAFRFSSRIVMATLTSVLLAALTPSHVQATDNRAPDLPDVAVAAGIPVPEGNKVHFRVYAEGVQIYTATVSPTDATKLVWTFTAPEAVLYDFDGNVVGIHYAYAGPTRPAWETSSGSLVVGARVAGVTVDATAIAWLRLGAVSSQGPGILNGTTYIQRVNTAGGLAPSVAPTEVGQQTRIPYTTEYYFYRDAK